MRFSVVFLALFALAAAVPTVPKHAADQEILKKQQDILYLLENIVGELPQVQLREIGINYDIIGNLQNYENPSVVKYYAGLVLTGHVQPQGTPLSQSVSQLRKEVSLLTQILLGAKNYETFLNTAAWARVHVNQDQLVAALATAVLQRQDLIGVILPPVYEVYPHYFFDTRIIQKVQDYISSVGLNLQQGQSGVYDIYVNYTSLYPYGENQIAYLTEDIGLSAYYYYVQLASYMLPYQQGIEGGQQGINGHGAHYYYIHQQLLARYNLERLAQGLGPIQELDDYYEHLETPYKPNLRLINGVNIPGRDEHVYITPSHHNYELIKLVRLLERRILDAIHSGHVITPQGVFLSLYQPQGLNILGELIEGTGRSINPRYYGSFQYVARQLLGNAPIFNNIWEYTPSALELGQTAVRDPMFYQLYSKIIELFHYYQEGLPSYQYNDIVLPGVSIEKVEFSELVTYFSDYEVNLGNAYNGPIVSQQQHIPKVKAHLKRLDHKPYEYSIHVQAQKAVPGAVVRVYVGPKYNYDGQPIDINVHRHYFYEIDQFVHDLIEGQNVIVRNSHQSLSQSSDYPSVEEIKQQVQGAMLSQGPYYIQYPEQLFGFPARLTLPKGTLGGVPLQLLVIISSPVQGQLEYGPVIEEEWATYQPQHYQIVGEEEYQQLTKNPIDKITGGYQTVEVIPEFEGQVITEGNWHWGYLYKKYPGSYYYPHWQQQYYNVKGGVSGSSISQGPVISGSSVHQGPVVSGQQGVYGGIYGQQGIKSGSLYGYGGLRGQRVQSGDYLVKGGYGQGGVYQGQGVQGQIRIPSSGVKGSGYQGYQGSQGYQSYQGVGHEIFENKFIGDVIGGVVSLDGKPLGYPLDRQLAHSAFYARNLYVQDVVVYHDDEYIPEY